MLKDGDAQQLAGREVTVGREKGLGRLGVKGRQTGRRAALIRSAAAADNISSGRC